MHGNSLSGADDHTFRLVSEKPLERVGGFGLVCASVISLSIELRGKLQGRARSSVCLRWDGLLEG